MCELCTVYRKERYTRKTNNFERVLEYLARRLYLPPSQVAIFQQRSGGGAVLLIQKLYRVLRILRKNNGQRIRDQGAALWSEARGRHCVCSCLFGHREYTWTGLQNKSILLPRDLLPTDVPNARMLTFGYDADVVKSGSEVQVKNGTMESHAADLSDALARLRLGTTSVNPRFSKNST